MNNSGNPQKEINLWFNLVEDNHTIKINRETSKFLREGLHTVILLQSSSETFILRITRIENEDMQEKLRISKLLDVLDHLGSEISLTQPIPWDNGSLILELKDDMHIHLCSLYNFVEGEHLVPVPVSMQYKLGSYMARFHTKMMEWDSDIFGKWDIDQALKSLEDICKKDDLSGIYKIKEKIFEIYASFTRKLATGLVHGDLHNHNVLIHGDNVILMDFDGLSHNFLAFDIASFIGLERFILMESKKPFVDYTNLISGYNVIRQLSQEEMQLLPIFQIHRFIHLMSFWSLLIQDKDDPICIKKLNRRIEITVSLINELMLVWEKDPGLYLDTSCMQKIHERYF